MKKLTEMIGIRGVGPNAGYFMKVVYCKKCGAEHTIALEEEAPRCKPCKLRMRVRWHEIDKPDYTEHQANYHKRDRNVKEVGKNPKRLIN